MADDVLALLRGDIHGDGAFVAVGGHEIGGQIGAGALCVERVVWPPAACVIAAGFGVFDLDNCGTHVAQ